MQHLHLPVLFLRPRRIAAGKFVLEWELRWVPGWRSRTRLVVGESLEDVRRAVAAALEVVWQDRRA